MRKGPVCDFPKLPTGPSAAGSAGVRRVQQYGATYRRTRVDSDTVSIQSGDFSRVIRDDLPEYVTYAVDGSNSVVRDTQEYRRTFQKSRASANIPGLRAYGGNDFYASGEVSDSQNNLFSFDYETYPGNTESVTFERNLYFNNVLFGGYFSSQKLKSRYEVYYMMLPITPGKIMYFRVGDDVSYWGKHPTYRDCFISLSIARLGRQDPANSRNLSDLTLIRHRKYTEATSIEEHVLDVSDFTRSTAEFMSLTKQVVLTEVTVMIFAEMFFRPGPISGGVDYVPKFWIATTPNTELFGVMTYSDMTSTIFSGALQPAQIPTPVPHYSTISGRQYQFDLSATFATMNLAVVGDRQFVLSWHQRMVAGWRLRVALVTVNAGSATGSLTYESSDGASQSSVEYWQSIIYLGNGIVLAKVVSGFVGINKDVTFRKSIDGGQTWGSAFVPNGFAAPLKNQYFGELFLYRAAESDDNGVVLINSWDPSDGTYRIYRSEDAGATWERKARIYKPDSFLRIDSMIAGDGGENFNKLAPGPGYRGDVDRTIADRYKERS